MLSIKEVLSKSSVGLEKALKKVSPYRTGRLRRSIEQYLKGNVIQISMYRYGETLNRGVRTEKYKGWIGEVFDTQIPIIKKQLIDQLKTDISITINKINKFK